MQAVAVAAEFNPDLVILDVRMPEMDGFELMARLKSTDPTPDIILMTGSIDDIDQKLIRALRGRAFYFIQKPFDREVLLTLVERCLELRWRREEHRLHTRRLEKELAEARAFQQGLLPDRDISTDRLAICCRYVSCSELGGDLYDYTMIRSGRTAFIIADVMGHGVSAAMLTGVVKSAFRSSDADDYKPAAVVQRVRSNLSAFGPERFVTLIAALLEADGDAALCQRRPPCRAPVDRADGTIQRLTGTGPLVSPALPRCRGSSRLFPWPLAISSSFTPTASPTRSRASTTSERSRSSRPSRSTPWAECRCSTLFCRRSENGSADARRRTISRLLTAKSVVSRRPGTDQRDPPLSCSKISSSFAASSFWPVRW